MFQIRVTKEGGITGYGEAWLKQHGKVLEFERAEDARIHAAEYMKRMNHSFATAFYRATVEEVVAGTTD